MLNSILPNLLNLGIVMLTYTLIRKKVKTGWLLGICIVGDVYKRQASCQSGANLQALRCRCARSTGSAG